jgi:hypothetical protein
MTLQLSGQIAPEDISGVKKLDRLRPVYLLVGDGGKVVVKRDNTPHDVDPRNMRTALRNMKIVDRTMATKQLTRAEMQALSQFVELKRMEAEMFNSPLADDVKSLSQDLEVVGIVSWVKTNFFDGLVNLESAAAMVLNEGKKTGIKAIAAALNLPGGFEKLGQILAVDAFNGNDDRFSFSNAPVVNPGFRRLTNPGNVAVCLQDNVLRPVGMDAYAGNAEFRSVAEAGPPDREWSGYRLREDQRAWRKTFCEEVEADLEKSLHPKNRFVSLTRRLSHNAAPRLAAGMDQGIVMLRTKLLAMHAPAQRPPGLHARIIALGWGIQARGGLQPAPPPGQPRR